MGSSEFACNSQHAGDSQLVGGSQSACCAQLTGDSQLVCDFELVCNSQLLRGSEFAYISKQLATGSELVTVNLLLALSL